jgi:hypothetical protein
MKPVELDEKWSKHPWSDWPPEVQSTPSDQRFGFVSHECINKKIIFISETSRRRDWICNFVLKEHCDIKSVHASCGPSSVTYCLWRWICIVRVCNFFHFDPFKNIFSQIDSRKTIFISGSEHRRQSSWRPSCTTGRPRWWRPRDPTRLEGRTTWTRRAPTSLAPLYTVGHQQSWRPTSNTCSVGGSFLLPLFLSIFSPPSLSIPTAATGDLAFRPPPLQRLFPKVSSPTYLDNAP